MLDKSRHDEPLSAGWTDGPRCRRIGSAAPVARFDDLGTLGAAVAFHARQHPGRVPSRATFAGPAASRLASSAWSNASDAFLTMDGNPRRRAKWTQWTVARCA